MEWWYQSAEERMSAPTVYPPPPPPPPPKVAKEGIPLPADKTICPLCSQKRANPSVVSASGFVFCYTCVFKYVSQVKHLLFSGCQVLYIMVVTTISVSKKNCRYSQVYMHELWNNYKCLTSFTFFFPKIENEKLRNCRISLSGIICVVYSLLATCSLVC